MKLGLLLCDHVRESLQPAHGDYREMFAGLFERLAADADCGDSPAPMLAVYDVTRGEYPAELDECDAYLATGSKFSVYEELPWISRLQAWVRMLHQAQKPLLGVCFGHQLIAQALGGEVRRASAGWGVGIKVSQVLCQQHWMHPYQSHLDLLVSHQDQVVALPPGAQVLMGSGFCPVAMFQVGNHLLGIQGHPEFTRGYAGDLMDSRREVIDAECLAVGQRSLEQPLDDLLAARWCLGFLRQAVAGRMLNPLSEGAGADPVPGNG